MVSVFRAYTGPAGQQLHYRIARPERDTGRPPLVCLHQTPKSGRDFETVMTRLGQDRMVIAPDTPGYGGSDPLPGLPGIADYAAALLSVLPDGPVDLLGYHTGGAIAAAIARIRPVRRMVLVSLAAFPDDERKQRLAAINVFPVPRADGGHIQMLWRLSETLNDARLDADWRSRALADCLLSGAAMPLGFRAVFDHDVAGDLAALDLPVLILCPQDDLRDATLAAAPSVRGARLVEWQGGNGFFDLDADAVSAVIDGFLDEPRS